MATKPKPKPKRKPKHAGGRPSQGLTEASILVTGPATLFAAVATAAEVEGVSVREYARRALRERVESQGRRAARAKLTHSWS